jgi:hypothetical protein
MARRRIWQVGCIGIDAVLSTSFDADELVMIDREFEQVYAIPDHPGVKVPHELLVYGMAHRACHSDNPTSERIEKRLNAMHARVIEEFERGDKTDVLENCYLAASEYHGNLAGCAWAMLTDPRPELRQHDLFWVQGLLVRSLLHWTSCRRDGPAERDEA